jgi:hypothetical protein
VEIRRVEIRFHFHQSWGEDYYLRTISYSNCLSTAEVIFPLIVFTKSIS